MHGALVEVRGHTLGVSSFALPCKSQGLNSSYQAWQQRPYLLRQLSSPVMANLNCHLDWIWNPSERLSSRLVYGSISGKGSMKRGDPPP